MEMPSPEDDPVSSSCDKTWYLGSWRAGCDWSGGGGGQRPGCLCTMTTGLSVRGESTSAGRLFAQKSSSSMPQGRAGQRQRDHPCGSPLPRVPPPGLCSVNSNPQSVTLSERTGVLPASGLSVCVCGSHIERMGIEDQRSFGVHVILCLLVLSPRVKRHFLEGHGSAPRPGMCRTL